jgi:hypothetical protein
LFYVKAFEGRRLDFGWYPTNGPAIQKDIILDWKRRFSKSKIEIPVATDLEQSVWMAFREIAWCGTGFVFPIQKLNWIGKYGDQWQCFECLGIGKTWSFRPYPINCFSSAMTRRQPV